LPAGFAPDGAVSVADTGLLISSAAGDMELTLDRGATWKLVATHCPMGTTHTVVTTSDGNELWQLCLDSVRPGKSKLFVSTNGGKSWSLRTSPPLVEKIFPSDASTILVSPRAGTAIFASNSETIKITHDGGRTWSAVGEPGIGFQSINFANATDGWAVASIQVVLTTSDGGDHWSNLDLLMRP
jgi:photosystem II stability/assembly factor-like uncharacterized protein